MKKINLVKKNFYFAVLVVVLLLVVSFVIAEYSPSQPSHEILYTNQIEPKSGDDINFFLNGNILVNGVPLGMGYWTLLGSNIYYNNGNVGIGTINPTEKLEVMGNIKASGMICDSYGCIGSVGPGVSLPICSDEQILTYNSAAGNWECGFVGEGAKIYSAIGKTNINLAGTAADTWYDMADMQITLPATFLGGNVYIHFDAAIRKSGGLRVRLLLDNSVELIKTPLMDLMSGVNYGTPGIQGGPPVSLSYVVENLAAGSHTISVQWGWGGYSYSPYGSQDGEISPRVMTVITEEGPQGGGGSGGSSVASLPTCSDGQTLIYNSAAGNWECGFGSSGGGVSFGEWIDFTSQAADGFVQGPAGSDGFIIAWRDQHGGHISVYTDSSPDPTTEICREGSGMSIKGTCTVSVRGGDYWKVVTPGGTATKIYWIPLVGGGGSAGAIGDPQTRDDTGTILDFDKIYRAETDGVLTITAQRDADPALAQKYIAIGPTNPPTVIVANANYAWGDTPWTTTIPVKEGYYWTTKNRGHFANRIIIWTPSAPGTATPQYISG